VSTESVRQIAERLRRARHDLVQVAADLQLSSWQGAPVRPGAISVLSGASRDLDRAAMTLYPEIPKPPRFTWLNVVDVGVRVSFLAAAFTLIAILTPPATIPLALALTYAAYAVPFLVLERTERRRDIRRTAARSRTQTADLAAVVAELHLVLVTLRAESSPRQARALTQVRRAYEAIVAADAGR
jgi:hypothetical protein